VRNRGAAFPKASTRGGTELQEDNLFTSRQERRGDILQVELRGGQKTIGKSYALIGTLAVGSPVHHADKRLYPVEKGKAI